LPFPCQNKVGLHKRMFSELNTPPGCTSVNASPGWLPRPTHHSRPRRLARSYLVRLFHSQLSSGFRRRTLTPFSVRLSPTHSDTFFCAFSVQKGGRRGNLSALWFPRGFYAASRHSEIQIVATDRFARLIGYDGGPVPTSTVPRIRLARPYKNACRCPSGAVGWQFAGATELGTFGARPNVSYRGAE